MALETNLERIKRDLEALSLLTATLGQGVTRLSLTPEDEKARKYLTDEMMKIGLTIKVDPPGNIRARLSGADTKAPIVMAGSHIDSVPNGGKFDGVVGVVGTLEALRVIKEKGIKTKHSLELIVFMDEEGARFGTSMLGSKFLVGKLNQRDMDRFVDKSGISLVEANQAFGISMDNPINVLKPGEVKAMIELHVEQSLILDQKKLPIGVIEGIAGTRWLTVTLKGIANHAGATPMNLRNDALLGAAAIISQINKVTKLIGGEYTRCTIGRIECKPNVSNVIPEEVQFTVDIRDIDANGIDLIATALKNIVKEVSEEHNLRYEIIPKSYNPPVKLPESIKNIISEEAENIGLPYLTMISGAVHDACLLTEVTDVGMIFVPSISGRSHCPEENTNYNDIKLGTDLLLQTLVRLAEPIA